MINNINEQESVESNIDGDELPSETEVNEALQERMKRIILLQYFDNDLCDRAYDCGFPVAPSFHFH